MVTASVEEARRHAAEAKIISSNFQLNLGSWGRKTWSVDAYRSLNELHIALTWALGEIGRKDAALKGCEAQFWTYRRQHLAKTPPDEIKAAINADMALMAQAALLPAVERKET